MGVHYGIGVQHLHQKVGDRGSPTGFPSEEEYTYPPGHRYSEFLEYVVCTIIVRDLIEVLQIDPN